MTGGEPTKDGQRRLPASSFYWALLDASGLSIPRRRSNPTRRDRERLAFLLEPHIPLPLEEWHAVFAPLGTGRFVACAMDKEALESAVDAEDVTLVPDELPSFLLDQIDDGALDQVPPNKLNLLSGPYTPTSIKNHHRRAIRVLVAVSFLATLFAVIGLERRRDLATREVEALQNAMLDIQEQVLGPRPPGSSLPAALRLESERRALRQTRDLSAANSGEIPRSEDVTPILADLLRHWPRDVEARTQLIVIREEGLHIHATLPSTSEAQDFAAPFSDMDGWTLNQPKIRRGGSTVRAQLQLVPDSLQADANARVKS